MCKTEKGNVLIRRADNPADLHLYENGLDPDAFPLTNCCRVAIGTLSMAKPLARSYSIMIVVERQSSASAMYKDRNKETTVDYHRRLANPAMYDDYRSGEHLALTSFASAEYTVMATGRQRQHRPPSTHDEDMVLVAVESDFRRSW